MAFRAGRSSCKPLFSFLVLVLGASRILAQEPTQPPVELPQVTFQADHPHTEIGTGSNAGHLVVMLIGNVRFNWGDVALRADKVVYNPKTQRGEATGNVIVTRGDESVRGDFFILDGTKALFDSKGATAVSPPFYVRGEHIASNNEGLRAENAHIALRPDGGGEILFRADQAQLRNDSRRLMLKNARISLYGARIISLPYVSLPFSFNSNNGLEGSGQTIPLLVRASQISGFAIGLGQSFTLTRGITAHAVAEQTMRQGIQSSLSLQGSFLSALPGQRSRRDIPLPGEVNPKLANASPIRQILSARVLPPTYDSILDFVDISTIPNPLTDPTRTGNRNLDGFLNVAYNREVAGRRQGPLLVSRMPEARLVWNLPLSGPLPLRDNAGSKIGLRKIRGQVLGEASVGRYTETRINDNDQRITRSRIAGTLGIGTLPLLLGNNLLATGQISYRYNDYSENETYRFAEASLAAEWIFGKRTALGAAFFHRAPQGETPFFFDQIDTQNEAQLRGSILLPGQRYILSSVARYDTTQKRLFDWEVTLGIRGNILEPRFSYRRLNAQFGFTIGIPGAVGM